MPATTELNFTLADAVCSLVSRGFTVVEASAKVGLHWRAVDRMYKTDPDFKDKLDGALALALGRVKRTVYEHAVDGDPRHIELYYREHAPELASQSQGARRLGPGGAGGGTGEIQVTVVNVVQQLLMGEAAPNFLDALHRPEAIDVTSSDHDDDLATP